MADFKKLSEVDLVEEVSNTANVLIEEGGQIKRASKTKIGGAGSDSVIKTAIITSSAYDSHVSNVASYVAGPTPPTYSCKNMTFEEAYEALTTGVLINVKLFDYYSGDGIGLIDLIPFAAIDGNVQFIALQNLASKPTLYWTSSGISTTDPTVS